MAGYIFKDCGTSRRVLMLSVGTSCILLIACSSQNTEIADKPVPKTERAKIVQADTSKLTTTTPAKANQNSELAQFLPVAATAQIADRKIALEVTRTPAEQAKGLMYRQALPDDLGMLFNFFPARPVAFWMKNVPVALDMVFIHNDKVVAIAESATPCAKEPCPIYPTEGIIADRVIELRAGLTKEIGLKIGDRITVTPKTPSSPPSPSPRKG
jgi:uncharacterized protein